MKKIFVLIISLITISGCGTVENKAVEPGTIGVESPYNYANCGNPGISIEMDEESLSNIGAKFIVTNNTEKTVNYGSPYSVEKYENGKWYKLKYVKGDPHWTMPLFSMYAGEYKIWSTDWEHIYGKLPNGHYRFVHLANFENEEEFCITYEFDLK